MEISIKLKLRSGKELDLTDQDLIELRQLLQMIPSETKYSPVARRHPNTYWVGTYREEMEA